LSYLYCLAAIVIWSSLEVTGKLVGAAIDPFTLTAWRFIIGGLILLPLAIRQNKDSGIHLNKSSILRIGSLGILNVCVSMLLLQLAIYYGKASLCANIISMNPLFVSIFAAMLIGEPLTKLKSISILCGTGGLCIIILGERNLFINPSPYLLWGILLAVLAAITFGLFTVLAKSSVLKHGNLVTNSISFLTGGLLLLLINILMKKPFIFSFNASNVAFMAYLGVVITGVSYLLYFEGMKQISAAPASAFFFLKPALASLLAYIVLGETISRIQALGVLLIVLSLSAPFFINRLSPQE